MTQLASGGLAELLAMLTYGRPHASREEAAFVERFISPLPGVSFDKYGNARVKIGTAPILWSCHTDTVHERGGTQQVKVERGRMASLLKPKRGRVLGADDGAGCWLMCEMIRAGTPGLYIFHAGEEVGGLGSDWIAKNKPELVREARYAIAFDRKGTTDIITHQGARCCSDAFAWSLAAKLGPQYRPDTTGTFTDTANYTDLIGECTNVSVGYDGAHSPHETLDLEFLTALRDRLVHFDATGLSVSRAPGDVDLDADDWPPMPFDPPRGKRRSYSNAFSADDEYDEALIEMCRDHPDIAARLICNLGGNASDMLTELWRDGYDIQ